LHVDLRCRAQNPRRGSQSAVKVDVNDGVNLNVAVKLNVRVDV
jgi:hypothetical protein